MELTNCISPGYSNHSSGYFYEAWGDTRVRTFLTEEELEQRKNKVLAILNNDGNGEIKKTIYFQLDDLDFFLLSKQKYD